VPLRLDLVDGNGLFSKCARASNICIKSDLAMNRQAAYARRWAAWNGLDSEYVGDY